MQTSFMRVLFYLYVMQTSFMRFFYVMQTSCMRVSYVMQTSFKRFFFYVCVLQTSFTRVYLYALFVVREIMLETFTSQIKSSNFAELLDFTYLLIRNMIPFENIRLTYVNAVKMRRNRS